MRQILFGMLVRNGPFSNHPGMQAVNPLKLISLIFCFSADTFISLKKKKRGCSVEIMISTRYLITINKGDVPLGEKKTKPKNRKRIITYAERKRYPGFLPRSWELQRKWHQSCSSDYLRIFPNNEMLTKLTSFLLQNTR